MSAQRQAAQGRAWIRRIRLINWHGHENATLDVVGDMLAIIGENGSGKSLILDAIDWALFPTLEQAVQRGGARGWAHQQAHAQQHDPLLRSARYRPRR